MRELQLRRKSVWTSSILPSNHSSHVNTSTASQTCSSNWRRTGRNSASVSCLICVFGGKTSWIFMHIAHWILSMKWNTALLETYLPQDTNQKSTYCSLHADTSATGSNLQATFVQVRRFKLISVKSHMVSAIAETLLWSYALILHLTLIIWFHVFGGHSDILVPSVDANLSVLQIRGNHLALRAPGTDTGARTLQMGMFIFPDTLK